MINSWNPAIIGEKLTQVGSGGGSSLPSVTSEDNGDVLGVVNGAWDKMAAPSGGVDYSTTEQDTGLKLGNKAVYQKSYSGTLTNGAMTELESSFAHNIIEANGFFKNTEGLGLSLGDLNTSGWNAAVHITTGLQLVIYTGEALYNGSYFVTIRYTKN